MTPKQKYLFDLRGYLHLDNVLTPKELGNAQAAIERLVQASSEDLPAGISRGGEGFSNGFSADKSLEALTLHPTTWPLIKELTWNKPRFNRGSLVVNTHERQEMTPLHCGGEDFRWTIRFLRCCCGTVLETIRFLPTMLLLSSISRTFTRVTGG